MEEIGRSHIPENLPNYIDQFTNARGYDTKDGQKNACFFCKDSNTCRSECSMGKYVRIFAKINFY
jgi:hypothetical protein